MTEASNIRWSVIVPFYLDHKQDRREMIQELLCSIPDRDDLEIILIDDRSILPWVPESRFHRAKLRVIKNCRPGRFAGAARNLGIEMASGSALFFADSDDKFSKRALDELLTTLVEDYNGWDVALFKLETMKDSDQVEVDRHSFRNSLIDRFAVGDYSALAEFHSPAGRVIKKTFLLANKISFEETEFANDVLFSVKLAISVRPETTRVFQQRVYLIRAGNVGLLSSSSHEALETRIKVACRANVFLENAHWNQPRFCVDLVAFHWGNKSFIRMLLTRWRARKLPGGSVVAARRLPIYFIRCLVARLKNFRIGTSRTFAVR